MANLKIGKVSHYYDKLGVAIVDLTSDLSMGDKIKFSHKDKEFEQQVVSMQVEHQQVQTAKKGQSIGLKVDQLVKPGVEVYKLS